MVRKGFATLLKWFFKRFEQLGMNGLSNRFAARQALLQRHVRPAPGKGRFGVLSEPGEKEQVFPIVGGDETEVPGARDLNVLGPHGLKVLAGRVGVDQDRSDGPALGLPGCDGVAMVEPRIKRRIDFGGTAAVGAG